MVELDHRLTPPGFALELDVRLGSDGIERATWRLEALGVKRSSIPSLVARDGLPGVRVAYRFRMDAVLAWCESGRRPVAHSRPLLVHSAVAPTAWSGGRGCRRTAARS